MSTNKEVAAMMDLLMLGIVPGTNIQIDFKTWLIASLALGGGAVLFALYRQRRGVGRAVRRVTYALGWRALLFGLRVQLAWRLRKTASQL